MTDYYRRRPFYAAGSENIMFTPEGGLAVKLINSTGAASVKGTLVESDTLVANAFSLTAVGEPDTIGIVYEDGIPEGAECWIVVGGIAEVLFIGSTALEQFARMCIAGDSGAAVGRAIAEAVPSSPFATDKHFMEIGHVIEARTGAGLAKCIIHFN